MEFLLEYPCNYEIEVLDRIDRVGVEEVLEFPGAAAAEPQRELDVGPILRVTPRSGRAWIATFANAGLYSYSAFVAWPRPDTFCVVHGGAGVCIQADEPRTTSELDGAIPIIGAWPVPDEGLVLLWDFTGIACYDEGGPCWRSQRLVWDDLAIVAVRDGTIFASGFDAPAGNTAAPLTVDLATGASSDAPYLS